eukprot:3556117-Amphidinium_carterae.1
MVGYGRKDDDPSSQACRIVTIILACPKDFHHGTQFQEDAFQLCIAQGHVTKENARSERAKEDTMDIA